jgi:hypothetical protein
VFHKSFPTISEASSAVEEARNRILPFAVNGR